MLTWKNQYSVSQMSRIIHQICQITYSYFALFGHVPLVHFFPGTLHARTHARTRAHTRLSKAECWRI